MDCIIIRCTSEERARLILKANQILAKLDELREDKTPVNTETILSKCALENLEANLERYMKGMNLI